MRHYAKLKGFTLSDNGLTHREGGRPVEPPCRTEADVFERLGLDWREPCDRELNVTPAAADGLPTRADTDEFGVLDLEHEPHDEGVNQSADSDDEQAITVMLRQEEYDS